MLDSLFENPIFFVTRLLILIISLAVHEYAHARAADHLGDPTPSLQGRLTLDPRKHIDPYGLLMLIVTGYGWAKPVQFDPFNLKNFHKDSMFIALAGPVTNFAIAIAAGILYNVTTLLPETTLINMIQFIFIQFILYNLVLGIFNLIPIHPLDGFKVVGGLLPKDQAHEWYKLERYGFIFLLMILIPFSGSSIADNIIDPILTPLFQLLTSGRVF